MQLLYRASHTIFLYILRVLEYGLHCKNQHMHNQKTPSTGRNQKQYMNTNHLDGHTSAEAPQPFFPHDTYSTQPGRERLLHRLLLRSRIYYIIGFLRVILRYRKETLSGHFNTATWSRAAMDCFRPDGVLRRNIPHFRTGQPALS